MNEAGILVVGASQAGVQIALSLRDQGYAKPITLVGAESHLPYQRPPLSKTHLTQMPTPAAVPLRGRQDYIDRRIDLVLGERISHIDRDVGVAHSHSGREFRFATLALATGARVRRLTAAGSDLEGVFYLRDLDDAHALARALPDATDVVVVGGGFIGLESCAAARSLGKTVTVVEAAPRLVARAVAPIVSDFLANAHERRGARVIVGRTVEAIEGSGGRARAVRLDDGERIPAQVVVVGVGVSPRTELAQALDLHVDGGIVVDAYARTSDPRIVAAGDCTMLPHPRSLREMVRLESVQNAQDQARVAAATLLDRSEPYTAVPWFWSDQNDIKLQIAGLSIGFEDVVVRGAPDEERFTVLYYRVGRLVAADCINRLPEYLAARRALQAGATVAPDRAADMTVPLKDLVTA